MLAWCIPLFGAPITIIGLILGITSLKSPSRGMAIAGIVLSAVGLVATVINGILGAYMAVTGQHPLMQG